MVAMELVMIWIPNIRRALLLYKTVHKNWRDYSGTTMDWGRMHWTRRLRENGNPTAFSADAVAVGTVGADKVNVSSLYTARRNALIIVVLMDDCSHRMVCDLVSKSLNRSAEKHKNLAVSVSGAGFTASAPTAFL